MTCLKGSTVYSKVWYEKKYFWQALKCVRTKLDEAAADFQKFRDALWRVSNCNSTGIRITEVFKYLFAIAIAEQVGRHDDILDEARKFALTQWQNSKAYGVLKSHFKFSDQSSSRIALHISSPANASRTQETNSDTPFLSESETESAANDISNAILDGRNGTK